VFCNCRVVKSLSNCQRDRVTELPDTSFISGPVWSTLCTALHCTGQQLQPSRHPYTSGHVQRAATSIGSLHMQSQRITIAQIRRLSRRGSHGSTPQPSTFPDRVCHRQRSDIYWLLYEVEAVTSCSSRMPLREDCWIGCMHAASCKPAEGHEITTSACALVAAQAHARLEDGKTISGRRS
jgi:hypothetical protein